MRQTRKSTLQLIIVVTVLLVLWCSELISGSPQWVWNPDANTAPARGDSGKKIVFNGQFADDEKEKAPVQLADTQPRLFLPGIFNAISNSISGNRPNRPGGSSSSSSSSSNVYPPSSSSNVYPPPSSGGGSGGSTGSGGGASSGDSSCSGGSCSGSCNSGTCVGGAIASQAINQGINAGSEIAQNQGITGVFGNFLQNIFGGSSTGTTLPGSIVGGGGNSDREPVNTGNCACVEASSCFLPNKAVGNCDSSGRRVRCCSTTRGSRTLFPDDDDRILSNSVNSVRTVTRSQIRRALLKNIVRGSGSLIDDTLDLILHPFLTKEDQLKVATRILDEQ